jgi:hypothetical protein
VRQPCGLTRTLIAGTQDVSNRSDDNSGVGTPPSIASPHSDDVHHDIA